MEKKSIEIIHQIKELAKSKIKKEDILKEVVKILKNNFIYYNWVGIYLLEGEELVLGPYLGKPSPHTRIRLNSGICGAAASQKKSIIIPDVKADSRYLACSLETKSEIVVPIMTGEKVWGEIDIDSDRLDAFTEEDKHLLEEICSILAELF
ncbi:MAG TPA: GAF domain-containing protein [candidate division Zixibacteria bacterium]